MRTEMEAKEMLKQLKPGMVFMNNGKKRTIVKQTGFYVHYKREGMKKKVADTVFHFVNWLRGAERVE